MEAEDIVVHTFWLSLRNLCQCFLLKITGIGDVVHSNTELIDISDAQMQREIFPLYIIHDNENIKSMESLRPAARLSTEHSLDHSLNAY